MGKISISKLRSNGFTAFEAEVINYALVNDLEVGTTFVGVPNHPRYGSSKEVEYIVEFNSEKLTIERGGKKTITVNFADCTTNINLKIYDYGREKKMLCLYVICRRKG